MFFYNITIINKINIFLFTIVFQSLICLTNLLWDMLFVFTQDDTWKDKFSIGEGSFTFLTIFWTEFNKFTLFVTSLVPTCSNKHFLFLGVPTLWLFTDKLVAKSSISSNFFTTVFVKIFHCFYSFQKHVLERNKTLGVVILYRFNWSSRSNWQIGG